MGKADRKVIICFIPIKWAVSSQQQQQIISTHEPPNPKSILQIIALNHITLFRVRSGNWWWWWRDFWRWCWCTQWWNDDNDDNAKADEAEDDEEDGGKQAQHPLKSEKFEKPNRSEFLPLWSCFSCCSWEGGQGAFPFGTHGIFASSTSEEQKVRRNSIARHVQCKIKRGSWDTNSWKVHISHVH